ncbi:hypothetical protein AALO_G00046310 [Alosa alosa]|uniref:Uncharacterized protein n=1 Tax=Alosa alosa TaxID=278164 RepID=A0AAV6HCU9_9TELE|nr:hypothetical protein AALO_G00046310 [Alosa alosa]
MLQKRRHQNYTARLCRMELQATSGFAHTPFHMPRALSTTTRVRLWALLYRASALLLGS